MLFFKTCLSSADEHDDSSNFIFIYMEVEFMGV